MRCAYPPCCISGQRPTPSVIEGHLAYGDLALSHLYGDPGPRFAIESSQRLEDSPPLCQNRLPPALWSPGVLTPGLGPLSASAGKTWKLLPISVWLLPLGCLHVTSLQPCCSASLDCPRTRVLCVPKLCWAPASQVSFA